MDIYDPLVVQHFSLSRRLVDASEPITFTVHEPQPGDRVDIYPHYLERCPQGQELTAPMDDPLGWVQALEHETLLLGEVASYTPAEPGNYLARLISQRYGVQYRYFAAVDRASVIYRPAVWSCWTYPVLLPKGAPEMHYSGLPYDWCLTSLAPDATELARLLEEQQRFGGGMVLGDASLDPTRPGEGAARLREAICRLRSAGLDAGRVANLWTGAGMTQGAARIAMEAGCEVVDGYVPRGSKFGMGAPYYPFYISPTDYRFPSQAGPTAHIACVYDFVGSWHFHGPVGFHRPSAHGGWEHARHYINLAAEEAVQTARNSGVHNFITTLVNVDSPCNWHDRDGAPGYRLVWDEGRGREFLVQYLHMLAFEQTRRWPIVFARAADYADYFRDHYQEMPRRVISSISHDLSYDRYWTDEFHERGLQPVGYVPFDQNLAAFRAARAMPQYNMPVSAEFINYNDNHRTCRFEYACPKPVHYYDLTGVQPWPEQPPEVDLPDPDITLRTTHRARSFELEYRIEHGAYFTDYLLAVWDIPREFRAAQVETNAEEFLWVENTDGALRGLLRLTLAPEGVIWVRFGIQEG